MVHLNAHMPDPDVHNIPHQHAFVLVGDTTHFAVHMTQFHCELHKYQLIFRITLSGKDDELRKLQARYPGEALFFCNGDDKADWFTIPSVGAGENTELRGNIFVGLRRPPKHPPPHFFPWSLDRVKPAIRDVTVKVERIVLFRPYVHHEDLPDYATFFLWGDGDEAHLTNKQIAVMDSGAFEARAYGPGVDFVGSLKMPPVTDPDSPPLTPVDWLDNQMLRAGTQITIPTIRMRDADTGAYAIPTIDHFLKEDETYGALYRGVTPARPVTMGPTFMYCIAVINSPSRIPNPTDDVWGIFVMPKHYHEKNSE